MARQKSILKIEGTLGDITFYRSKDGYLVRERGGISAERFRNDPQFQRTRENSSEFGRAGKAGKTLRSGLRGLLKECSDFRMVSRLTQMMMRVIHEDATSTRGQRNVIDGETELLTGFDFNAMARLNSCIFFPYTIQLERDSGSAGLTAEPFVPAEGIAAPEGTTHFKLVSSALAIDFEAEAFTATPASSAVIPWSTTLAPALELVNALPAGLTHPMFYAFGIVFYQEVNGEMYPLKNGVYNALQIVKVAGV